MQKLGTASKRSAVAKGFTEAELKRAEQKMEESEHKQQRKICVYFKKKGLWVDRSASGDFNDVISRSIQNLQSTKGFPDLVFIGLVCFEIHVLFVEHKKTNGRLTKEQKEFWKWFNDHNKSPHIHGVITKGYDDAIEKISKVFGLEYEQ